MGYPGTRGCLKFCSSGSHKLLQNFSHPRAGQLVRRCVPEYLGWAGLELHRMVEATGRLANAVTAAA
jgi:hypothetical protein